MQQLTPKTLSAPINTHKDLAAYHSWVLPGPAWVEPHSHYQTRVRQPRFRRVLVCQTVAKNQFWKEGVQFLLHFKVHREGKLRREGIQGRNWNKGRGATLLTGLLSMNCSVCFLVQPRITYPGITLLWVGDLDSPTSVINQELTHRLAHRPVWQAVHKVWQVGRRISHLKALPF